MNNLLTICIPTYNRATQLKECLSAIPAIIPIYVLDNASTDNTATVVNSFESIQYRRQSYNVNIDQNMIDAAKLADSKYIWMLGDDDTITPGAIEYVLKFLQEHDVSFVLLNANHLHNKELLHFTDAQEFFKGFWDKMPFSTTIIHHKILQSTDHLRYIGTGHAYTGIVWDYLATGNNDIYVLPRICLELGKVQKTWSHRYTEILLSGVLCWFDELPAIYNDVKKEALKNYLASQSTRKNFMRHRVGGSLSLDTWRNLTKRLPIKGKAWGLFWSCIPRKWIRNYNLYR